MRNHVQFPSAMRLVKIINNNIKLAPTWQPFHTLHVSLKIPVEDGKERIPVCSLFFQSIFEVKSRRILTIARGMHSGQGFDDHRGGRRVRPEYADKREAVRNFISNLKGSESHYGREKSRRIYLNSEWNVRRLFLRYNKDVDEHLQV